MADEPRISSAAWPGLSRASSSPPKIFDRSPPRGSEEDCVFPDPEVAGFPTAPGTYSPLPGVMLPPLGPLMSADGVLAVLAVLPACLAEAPGLLDPPL